MRISDWSSDVCSSDLIGEGLALRRGPFFIARPVLSAEDEDWAAPGLEAVLGGDADPERIIALRLQRDAQAVRHAAVRVVVRQAEHSDSALEAGGLQDDVVAADLRQRTREAAVVAGELEAAPRVVGAVLREDRVEAADVAGGERIPFHRVARPEEHTSALQSLMRVWNAGFCLTN